MLAIACIALVVQYFPGMLPWWADVGVMMLAVVVLIVLGWPLLSIGKSGRDAIAQRERELRESEANPLRDLRRGTDGSAGD
jgi:membrane protein implicated in regulation of membrane protease activity